MKCPCNLIKDILPLYYDGVVSEDSKTAVEEHLTECENCRVYYEKICQSDVLEDAVFDEEIAKKSADSFKEVSKALSKKIAKITFKAICITALVAIGVMLGLYALIVFYLTKTAEDSWETHYDISEYGMLDDGRNLLELSENLRDIWPENITEKMRVEEYLLIHYQPWDSNYLGYLEVGYSEAVYQAEVSRLNAYESTEYIGNYGAGEFKEKELLAMYSDSHCFIYALTDGENKIYYVYFSFPAYSMDIDYDDYIPKDCLPKGLDLSEDNPVRQQVLKEREEDLERYKEQVKGSSQ